MDNLYNELIEFWKSLNKFNVAYIMIGGFAVNLHGFARTTGDIDIWLKDEAGSHPIKPFLKKIKFIFPS